VVSGYLGADCRQYATEELMELLAYNEIPAGRVNTRAEVVDDPQVQAAGILRDVEHPRGGTMRQPRSPLRFSKTVEPRLEPSADLGEHTVEVLADLGLTLKEMQGLARQGVIA